MVRVASSKTPAIYETAHIFAKASLGRRSEVRALAEDHFWVAFRDPRDEQSLPLKIRPRAGFKWKIDLR